MEPYNIQFGPGADEAFEGMPTADQKEFARSVMLLLQSRPDRGNAAYEVFSSMSTPGLFHLTFGTSIVSYSIDPSRRLVHISEFTY
jgi:hypothetical protein